MYGCSLKMVALNFIAVCVVMATLSFSLEVDEDLVRRWMRDEIEEKGNFDNSKSKRLIDDLLEEIQQLKITVSKLQSTDDNKSKRLVLDNEVDLVAEIQQLKSTVSALQSIGSGSTYVRWGRTDCPGNGSDLVYKGFAGGSHYTQPGGGANYVCLTDEPIYGYFQRGEQSGALVYGAEYEMPDPSAFFNQNLHNDDVPCAVCRTTRPSVLMIPGRNACTAGWTLEYKGYLTGGYTGHAAASEFVCLDDHPVAITGGHANKNGKLFYFAEGRCGSLQCPPYADGQELTCAVCSK